MNRKQGFTLIELLVVITVISILAGMMLPALGKARSKAIQTACASQLKQIYVGESMYINDNKEYTQWPMSSNGYNWKLELVDLNYFGAKNDKGFEAMYCPGQTNIVHNRHNNGAGYAINGWEAAYQVTVWPYNSVRYAANKVTKFKYPDQLTSFLDWTQYRSDITDNDKTFFVTSSIWKWHGQTVNVLRADGHNTTFYKKLPGERSLGRINGGKFTNSLMWRIDWYQ